MVFTFVADDNMYALGPLLTNYNYSTVVLYTRDTMNPNPRSVYIYVINTFTLTDVHVM